MTTENEKMKAELTKVNENKKQILQERHQLQKNIDELKEKCIGKGPLQGAKHIIWDSLTIEITKFRHYLSFIDDLCTVTELAQQRLQLVNEHGKKAPHYSSKFIKFSEFPNTPKAARHGHFLNLNSAIGEEDYQQTPFNEYCPR